MSSTNCFSMSYSSGLTCDTSQCHYCSLRGTCNVRHPPKHVNTLTDGPILKFSRERHTHIGYLSRHFEQWQKIRLGSDSMSILQMHMQHASELYDSVHVCFVDHGSELTRVEIDPSRLDEASSLV